MLLMDPVVVFISHTVLLLGFLNVVIMYFHDPVTENIQLLQGCKMFVKGSVLGVDVSFCVNYVSSAQPAF